MTLPQSYSVWMAFGEPVIVAGTEPVWEAPGQKAAFVTAIEATDYDTACRLYSESLNSPIDKEIDNGTIQ
jgi:hypothetical protein